MGNRSPAQNAAEAWKDIPGFVGLYQISSLGRVKSLPRTKTAASRSGNIYTYPYKGKILKPQIGGTGYLKVCLHRDGEQLNFNIHRLLAEAFIPNPDELPQINHKNGIKADCRLDNLEWCTPSQNMKHAYAVIGISNGQEGQYGEAHNCAKPVLQLSIHGEIIKRWGAGSDAVRAGFESSCISRCCNGLANTHKGYRWEYA